MEAALLRLDTAAKAIISKPVSVSVSTPVSVPSEIPTQQSFAMGDDAALSTKLGVAHSENQRLQAELYDLTKKYNELLLTSNAVSERLDGTIEDITRMLEC